MAEITNYEELIEKADEVGQNLSDEQIAEISGALSEQAEHNPSVQELRDAKAEADANADAKGFEEEGLAVIDPTTGKVQNIIDPDNNSFLDASLEDILNDPNIIVDPIDKTKVEIRPEDIKTVVSDTYNLNTELSAMDIDMIITAVDKYKKGEKFPYYNALPQCIKDQINAVIMPAAQGMGTYAKQGRNYAAEQFLQFILDESSIQGELIDLQHSIRTTIKESKDEINQSLSDMSVAQKEQYEVKLPEIATKLEEEGQTEKAELLRKSSKNFTQSYTYEELLAAYKSGKIKVKPIQLDKFARTCSEFNLKYKDSKTVIPEISMIVPVLDRHADKKYDLVVIREFVVAFINYTKFMKADKIDDHIFMYYFIQHILSFDYYNTNNEDDKKFHEELLANINNFLEVIMLSRQERGKKGGK